MYGKTYSRRTIEAFRQPRVLGKRVEPECAYLMMGHGGELHANVRPVVRVPSTPTEPNIEVDNTVVPPGCTLIVLVHSGELLADNRPFLRFFNGSLTEEELVHPEENLASLRRVLRGPVAIYKEGDTYPDFEYQMISAWAKTPNVQLMASGLAKSPFTLDPLLPSDFDLNTFPQDTPVGELEDTLLRIFSADTYSHPLELEQYILQNPTMPLREFIRKLMRGYAVTQSDLFRKVLQGTMAPGVFYNVICRGLMNERKNYYQHPSPNLNRYVRSGPGSRLRKEHGSSKGAILPLRKNTMPDRIFRRLSEAVGQRAPYMSRALEKSPSNVDAEIAKRYAMLEEAGISPRGKNLEQQEINELLLRQQAGTRKRRKSKLRRKSRRSL